MKTMDAWTRHEYLSALVEYVQLSVQEHENLIDTVDRLYQNKTAQPKDARLNSPEEYFTAHFLLPAIYSFHAQNVGRLGLSIDQLSKCLRAESHTRSFLTDPSGQKLFQKSPASTGKKHLLAKKDIAPGHIPGSANLSSQKYENWGYKQLPLWRKNAGLTGSHFSVCPDFAISAPCPYTAVGEVKLLRFGNGQWSKGAVVTKDEVWRAIYDLAKEVVFYIGSHAPNYECGILVVADATETDVLRSVVQEMHPDLLNNRFGDASGLYLLPITL